MLKSSRLVLNCDPEYTAHREAAKHREETRDWLRERERIVRERTLAAPSIVPEASEWPRPWGARAPIRMKDGFGLDRFG
jgi:hypothetical protein